MFQMENSMRHCLKLDYFPFQNGVVNVNGENACVNLCHQEFENCLMGSITSSSGDVWSTNLPQIFSGHIHEYQVLPSICYVGTPIQQNYGESPDKALMMLYLEEKDGKLFSKTMVSGLILRRGRLPDLNSRLNVSHLHPSLAKLPFILTILNY